jgi:Ca2+-transporting ATPase
VTAEAIARELGIEGRAITGAEFAAMSDEQAAREIGGIGVIARVSPEDKVHLVNVLKAKGNVVSMTGDGVNDAPALKAADIGVAMGITGTEVSKQAAVMILTDDNFATIIKAVGLGRAVYDNMMRFIRFQMAGLFGYIGTFLGASLLNVLGGIPFLPLQTMWLNFTVNVFQGVGLGYGKPREGLMEVPPRPKTQQIMPRRLTIRLVADGLLMAAGTLIVLSWGGSSFGDTVARTMGMTTFALFRLFSSLEEADDRESVFAGGLLSNRPLLIGTGISVLTIVLATSFGFLQNLLDTTNLTADQWAICILVALSIIVVEEVRKALKLGFDDAPAGVPAAPSAAPAAA